MSLQVLKRKPLIFIYTAGIILLIIAGWLWWSSVSTKTDRVWWGMIQQSMATSGVTVQASSNGNGTNINQTTQYSFGAQNISHSLTNLTQGTTTVQDEMIATTDADYTRYVSIKTDKKSASGKALNFSKIAGVWAKSGNAPQLFTQNILGLGTNLPTGATPVPIASLNAEQRTTLFNQIKNQSVYDVSFKDVKKDHKNGRLVYVYTVKIQPQPYAAMMKTLAKSIGIHNLDDLDPKTFAGQQPSQMKLTVDVHSRQLISAESADGSAKQTYSSYDIPVQITPPKTAITSTELQKRLTQLQQ